MTVRETFTAIKAENKDEPANIRVLKCARAYMLEHNLPDDAASFTRARDVVFADDPALHREYLNENGEMRC